MPVAVWSGDAFVAEATAWVTDNLRELDLAPTGTWAQPHCRPWSSTISFETTGGRVWFKVNGPGTRHEATLLRLLGRLLPGLVPEVLAVDADRGWSLSRDAGPVLRSLAAPQELWDRWAGLLARYADAQLATADHVPALLATGTPEVSPATLPGLAAALVDELSALDPLEGGLTGAEATALADRLPVFERWCAELAASGLPTALQHDDLHSANICCDARGVLRIIDWGDASVGFPLATMLCTLNSIAHHAGCGLEDPRLRAVRDAYLEPFTRCAGRADLVRYVDLARRTGAVTRALSYRAALAGEPPSTHAQDDFPVRGWLLELITPE